MPDDTFKDTVSQLANALQVVTVLSTKLRRELHESVEDAVQLESEADKAISAARRLQPKGGE